MRELIFIWVGMLMGLALLAFGTRTETPSQSQVALVEGVATSSPQLVQKAEEGDAPLAFPVVKVVDGDTAIIQRNGKNETLRFIGMDAPETTTVRKGVVECFGKEATRRAEELLEGISVTLETDASQGMYDKYGRTLAYIILPDGRNFARVMIEEGYAHEYTYNTPYTYQKEFRAAQTTAKQIGAGLWNSGACVGTAVSQAPTTIVAPPGNYECSKNAYNCTSFKSQLEAQAAFDSCGGSENDVHKLDSDGDGQVCEGLR